MDLSDKLINLMISGFCFLCVFYHLLFNTSIITHRYMAIPLLILVAVGGFNYGIFIGKVFRENKKSNK